MLQGAYAPPLLVVLRCGRLPAKLRLVRYTNARSTRAAGVSPPWFGNAVADAIAVPGLSTSACHGWLTPIAPGAALDGGTPIVAKARLRFARAIRFTATAGLRQPLLVHDARPLKNSDIRGAQTHILQERRASARRGGQNRSWAVTIEH
jgi:hypothetical protein